MQPKQLRLIVASVLLILAAGVVLVGLPSESHDPHLAEADPSGISPSEPDVTPPAPPPAEADEAGHFRSDPDEPGEEVRNDPQDVEPDEAPPAGNEQQNKGIAAEEQPMSMRRQDDATRLRIVRAREATVAERTRRNEAQRKEELEDPRIKEVDVIMGRAAREHSQGLIDRSLFRLAHALEALEPLPEPIPDSPFHKRDHEIRERLASQLQELHPVEYMVDAGRQEAQLSRDGRYCIFVEKPGDERVVIWDLDGGQEAKAIDLGDSGRVGLFPSGNRERKVIVQERPGPRDRVWLWDWGVFGEIPLPVHDLSVAMPKDSYGGWRSADLNLAVDFRGGKIPVVGDREFGLWDLERGILAAKLRRPIEYHSHVFAPDGEHLLVENSRGFGPSNVLLFTTQSFQIVGNPFRSCSLDLRRAVPLNRGSGVVLPSDHRVFSTDGTVARINHRDGKELLDAFTGDPRESGNDDPAFQDLLEVITFGGRFIMEHDVKGTLRKETAVRRRAKLSAPEPIPAVGIEFPFRVSAAEERDRILVACRERVALFDSRLAPVSELDSQQAGGAIADAVWIPESTVAGILLENGSFGFWAPDEDHWESAGQHNTTRSLGLCRVPHSSRILSVGLTATDNLELRLWDSDDGSPTGLAILIEPFPDQAKQFGQPIVTLADRSAIRQSLAAVFSVSMDSEVLVSASIDGLWPIDLTDGTLADDPIGGRDGLSEQVGLDWGQRIVELPQRENHFLLHELSWGDHARCRFIVSAEGSSLSAELVPAPLSQEAELIREWIKLLTARSFADQKTAATASHHFDFLRGLEWRRIRSEFEERGIPLVVPEITWDFDTSP